MNPEHSIENRLPYRIWAETRILLAVSGGADSVAMLRAVLRRTNRPDYVEVAHFNHGWRAEESERDQQFVTQLCAQLGVRLHVARADQVRGKAIAKSEEAARHARYEFLTGVAYQIGARYVLTAHNANDRVETVLHNLFRGTGLAGVRSLETTRPLDEDLVLARPLLDCRRPEIIDYLAELGQDFCEDSSNGDLSFRRNFLRNSLLPTIENQYGHATGEKILSFSDLATELDSMVCSMAADYLKQSETLARDALRSGQLDRLNRTHIVLPSHDKLPVHWPVLRQALVYVWLDRGWALGKMTREHWRLIQNTVAVSSAENSVKRKAIGNLPGALQVVAWRGWIEIRQQQQTE